MMERLGLTEYVHLFRSDYAGFTELKQAVSSWWDLPAIEAQYAAFTDTYRPVALDLRQYQRLDDVDAFRAYVPMLTEWRRLPYLDPGLPTELLPADWNAVEARRVFVEIHALLAAPSMSHVVKVTGLEPTAPTD